MDKHTCDVVGWWILTCTTFLRWNYVRIVLYLTWINPPHSLLVAR